MDENKKSIDEFNDPFKDFFDSNNKIKTSKVKKVEEEDSPIGMLNKKNTTVSSKEEQEKDLTDTVELVNETVLEDDEEPQEEEDINEALPEEEDIDEVEEEDIEETEASREDIEKYLTKDDDEDSKYNLDIQQPSTKDVFDVLNADEEEDDDLSGGELEDNSFEDDNDEDYDDFEDDYYEDEEEEESEEDDDHSLESLDVDPNETINIPEPNEDEYEDDNEEDLVDDTDYDNLDEDEEESDDVLDQIAALPVDENEAIDIPEPNEDEEDSFEDVNEALPEEEESEITEELISIHNSLMNNSPDKLSAIGMFTTAKKYDLISFLGTTMLDSKQPDEKVTKSLNAIVAEINNEDKSETYYTHCLVCGSRIDIDDYSDFEVDFVNTSIRMKGYSIEYYNCPHCKTAIMNSASELKYASNTLLVDIIKKGLDCIGLEYLGGKFKGKYTILDSEPKYIDSYFLAKDKNSDELSVFNTFELIRVLSRLMGAYSIPNSFRELAEGKFLRTLELNKELLSKDYKVNRPSLQVNVINSIPNGLLEAEYPEEDEIVTFSCKGGCDGCLRDFTLTSINELIVYAFNLDKHNCKNCLLYKATMEADVVFSVESLPELSEREIATIRKYRPNDTILEPFIQAYKEDSRFAKADDRYIKERAVRDWANAMIESEDEDKKKKSAEDNMDDLLFGMDDLDDEERSFTMGDKGFSNSTNTKRKDCHPYNDNNPFEPIEETKYYDDLNRKRNERLKEGRVRAEEIMDEILTGVEENDVVDPALESDTLVEVFKKSVFYTLFEKVVGHKFHDSSKVRMKLQLNKDTAYIAIMDVSNTETSEDFRFVLVDTDDYLNASASISPFALSDLVPFHFHVGYGRRNERGFRMYPIYKCDVHKRMSQIVNALVKLINYRSSYPEDRVCKFNDQYVPAYVVDRTRCDAFFDQHSLLTCDRFHVDSLVVTGIIDPERSVYQDSASYQKHRIYKERMEPFFKNKSYNKSQNYIVGLVGIKYYKSVSNNSYGEVTHATYTITQYTENVNLMMENGFWYCVMALMKEHDYKYNTNRPADHPRVTLTVRFEFDRAYIPSPVICELLREDGCMTNVTTNFVGEDFEKDESCKWGSIGDTEYATVILDPAYRNENGIRYDKILSGIVEGRYFSNIEIFKRFFKPYLTESDIIESSKDIEQWLVSKGFWINFTLPSKITVVVRGSSLAALYRFDEFEILSRLKSSEYMLEEIDRILAESDHINSFNRGIAPLFDKIVKDVDNPTLKSGLEIIGQTVTKNDIQDILSFFKPNKQ